VKDMQWIGLLVKSQMTYFCEDDEPSESLSSQTDWVTL